MFQHCINLILVILIYYNSIAIRQVSSIIVSPIVASTNRWQLVWTFQSCQGSFHQHIPYLFGTQHPLALWQNKASCFFFFYGGLSQYIHSSISTSLNLLIFFSNIYLSSPDISISIIMSYYILKTFKSHPSSTWALSPRVLVRVLNPVSGMVLIVQ